MCDTKIRLIYMVRMFLLIFFIYKQTLFIQDQFLFTAISNYSTLMVGRVLF